MICGIGLDNPKSNYNIGSVLRAASVYQASFVALKGERYKKASTDTVNGYKNIPLFRTDDLRKIIPYDCIPIAIDKVEDAIPLPEYKHPENAFYIFGAEDATLGKRVISWCKDVVYIPMNNCMNLAATVNVVLYDRMAKNYNLNKNNIFVK